MAKKRGGYKNLTGNWQDTVNGVFRPDDFVPFSGGPQGLVPNWGENRAPVRDGDGRPLKGDGSEKVDWNKWQAEIASGEWTPQNGYKPKKG